MNAVYMAQSGKGHFMKTEFIKLKNAFGIKELRKSNLINGDVLIYAPNGVMKTSFADALQSIKESNEIIDAFGEYSSPAEYEIKQNGKVYSETNNDGSLQMIVFTSKTAKENIFTEPNIANIAMSAELRRSYDEQIKNISEIKKRIDSLVSITIKGAKRTVSGSWASIASIFDANSDLEVLEALYNYDQTNTSLFENAQFSKVCDDKIMKVFEDREFGEKVGIYKKIVEEKMESEVLKNGFDFTQLDSVSSSINSSNYFDAGHSMLIANKAITTREELQSLVDEQRKKVFGSPEVESAFSDVKSKLTANPATRGFSDFLSSSRGIIDYSSDYNEARKIFCKTKVVGLEKDIQLLIRDYKLCLKKIDSLVAMAQEEESDWKRAKDLFNDRFSLNRVDLEIVKRIENDVPVPRIVMIDKNTKREIDYSMKSRLSSGEMRALLILNLLFEIESKKKIWPDGFVLVLDDIADSFDYKNKYAICRYIEELFLNSLIQVVVMTHNYDFYRCCKFFVNKTRHKELVATRLRRGVIKLDNAGHSDLQNLSFTSNWKAMLMNDENSDDGRNITFLAYMPVLRNAIEVEKDSDYEHDYRLICQYLHYSKSTFSSSVVGIKNLFEKHGIYLNDSFYTNSLKDIIHSAYERYRAGLMIDQFDVRTKIALAIVLRILFEKFLIQKTKKPEFDYDEQNSHKKYEQMYEQLLNKKMLSPKDIENCEFAIIVANPYIHVNAFMYEQLIDNSGDRIVECIKHFEECLNS